MKSLLVAISFLTTIPVPQIGENDSNMLGRSTVWFPLVGLLIGGLVAGAYYGLGFIFPVPAVAVFATIIWVALTGGLHLDGLADSFDGLLPSVSREKRLSILKDVHLGAFGVIGLVLTLIAKVVLLFSLPKEQLFFAIPLGSYGTLGFGLAALQPSARPGGLGDMTAQGMRKYCWLLALLQLLLMLGLAVYFGGGESSYRGGSGSSASIMGFCERAQEAGWAHWRSLVYALELSELAV